MARSVIIAGRKFYRRSVIKLSSLERSHLRVSGTVTVRRPVEWPLGDRRPRFEAAYVDPGNTDIWGPGPYLKVPNLALSDADSVPECVNRVFCPWGYPPDRLRLSRRSEYVALRRVGLVVDGAWFWELDLGVAVRNLSR